MFSKKFEDFTFTGMEKTKRDKTEWSQIYARTWLNYSKGKCAFEKLEDYKLQNQLKSHNPCFEKIYALAFEINEIQESQEERGLQLSIEDESEDTILKVSNKMEFSELMVVKKYYSDAKEKCLNVKLMAQDVKHILF